MTRLPPGLKSRSSGGFAAIRMTAICLALTIVSGAVACHESVLAPLPLDITISASKTTVAPGDTITFVATVQGGYLLGLTADYGDNLDDIYGTSGARTGKVTFRHAYAARGTYTTKITLTDATLGNKTASVDIHVN